MVPSNALEIPKSAIFTNPFDDVRILAGLISPIVNYISDMSHSKHKQSLSNKVKLYSQTQERQESNTNSNSRFNYQTYDACDCYHVKTLNHIKIDMQYQLKYLRLEYHLD